MSLLWGFLFLALHDLGNLTNLLNPFRIFLAYECAKIAEIASFRLGLTRVQEPVRSEWHIEDGGQLLSKKIMSVHFGLSYSSYL